MKPLIEMIARHKAGQAVGIYSVCSAHHLVIEAALRRAQRDSGYALIEATSNQVNQDGGYTGMRPVEFARYVREIAARVGLPSERVLLGGDHLGPNCWQQLDAGEAMQRSERLVADYVAAGFRKIHLDCSMSCGGDPPSLGDETVAARAARLCRVAEQTWRSAGGDAPVYVVGTEVPVPGGAHESLTELTPTAPAAAAATIEAHRKALTAVGLGEVWPRVIGLVVQPGVEFDHYKVVDYRPELAGSLSALAAAQPHMLYEAHSTDYQTPENLRALVRGHFAILKVGPGADLRAARGAVGARTARARVAAARAAVAAARDGAGGHGGQSAALGEVLRRQRSRSARSTSNTASATGSATTGRCRKWKRR